MKKSILYVCLAVLFWQGAAFAAFIDNGNGTITDTGTGLMWQKATAPGTYTWEQALTYCENLTLGGHSDWRLPNRNELQSIVDYSRYNPAIDTTFFPDTVASNYWSSTTLAFDTYFLAWFVDFFYGYVGYYGKPTASLFAPCAVDSVGHLVIPIITASPISLKTIMAPRAIPVMPQSRLIPPLVITPMNTAI